MAELSALEVDALRALLLKESIAAFYNREADLLDGRKLDEWIKLFTEDSTYTIPLQRNVKFGQWSNESRLGALEVAWMANTREVLGERVEQMLTGVHWAEEPVSRFAHLITNLSILNYDAASGIADVRSRFLVYRNRCETEYDFFVGVRDDVLQKTESNWSIKQRVVYLQQNVLLSKNISLFF
jgi:3-phenylpropionate/cinnamic acid dioxygenase small subunit